MKLNKQHKISHHMKEKSDCGKPAVYNFDGVCEWDLVTCDNCLKLKPMPTNAPPPPTDVEKLRDELAQRVETTKQDLREMESLERMIDSEQAKVRKLEALADKFIAEYKNIPPLDCNTQDKFAERIFDDRSKRCMVVNEFIDAYKRGVGK